MKAAAWPYQQNIFVSLVIFLVSGIAAIIMQQPLWVLISFAWLLVPVVYEYVIAKPATLFWLLLIALPLSTELNITPQLGLDFPDEPLLILLTGVTIVKIIYQPAWFPVALKRSSLFLILVIYFIWMMISCAYSVEAVLSVKYLLAKIWYIVPFVVLPQVMFVSKESIKKMAVCLLGPMLLVVIQTLIRHSFYHFSFEKIQQTLAPFFRNHVNYSSMLVCLLPVGWCVWKLTPADHSKRKWIFAGLIIGATGLLFAYSRGAWIALLLGVFAAWIIQKKMMGAFVMIAVTGVMLSTAWLVTDKNYMRFAPDHDHTVFHTDFSQHMRATVEMKDVSTAERFYRWIAGAKMLADKPLTGFGPNTFYLHYRPYTVRPFETWVSDNKEHSTVHNYFILVALEQGIIGLVFFSILYFGMLLHAQKLYHRLKDPFYKMMALTTAIVLVMIGVINSMSDMIETDKIGSLFWLCLGMIVLLEERGNIEYRARNVE